MRKMMGCVAPTTVTYSKEAFFVAFLSRHEAWPRHKWFVALPPPDQKKCIQAQPSYPPDINCATDCGGK